MTIAGMGKSLQRTISVEYIIDVTIKTRVILPGEKALMVDRFNIKII